MISLKRKPKAGKCTDHRTISLIAHAAKVAASVLGEDQFGFRKEKELEIAIEMLRIISEQNLDKRKEICVCFIDWQKVFDRVKWTKLMEILKKTGNDCRERILISKLYMDQSVKIGRGVRRECCSSPLLFNFYSEYFTQEAVGGLVDSKVMDT
jgi:hypothetical protein